MSLIRRFKQRVQRFGGRDGVPALDRPQRNAFSVSLPNPLGGRPLCRATFAWTTTHHADGDSLRLQAHVDGAFYAPPVRDGRPLSDGGRRSRGLVAAGRDAARGLARRGLTRMPAQRLRTWIDVQATTSPLASGAEALIPERLREICGGGLPRQRAGEPRIGIWTGPAGPGGDAQLALLQIDRDDFPSDYPRRPFSLIASVASLSEPAISDEGDAE